MKAPALPGLRLALTTFTIAPVAGPTRPDRRAAGRAMVLAPLVGVALGGVAAAADAGLPGLLGPVAAVAVLAALSRGLHLDGLADLADALGSRRPRRQALEIMRRGDVGPFGVATLVLTLLAQVAALTRLAPDALLLAAAAGRAAAALACVRGVPAARPDGLGAFVAGTVGRPAGGVLAAAVLAAGFALGHGHGTIAAAAAFAVAGVLLAHCVRRLGGISGDVLGALVETTTTALLVVAAVLR